MFSENVIANKIIITFFIIFFQTHISATRSGVGGLLIFRNYNLQIRSWESRMFPRTGLRTGRGRDAHAPRGCAMWGGADLGREGLCRKMENEEGKCWGYADKQGEIKIPQCRGACGTRIKFCGFYLLSLNILTILSNASDISDK